MRRCVGCGKVMKAQQPFVRVEDTTFCETACWRDWHAANKKLAFVTDYFRPDKNPQYRLCDDECECASCKPPDIAPAEPSTTQYSLGL